MSLGKFARVTDGPNAAWGTDDDIGLMVLTNGSTLKLGQPLSLDVTSLGPDQNVPNNQALTSVSERLVATTSSNAGPLYGVVTAVTSSLPAGVTLGPVAGVPTWTNSSGASVTLTVQVRQMGWAYVFAGTAAIGQTGGASILVGSTLVSTTAQVFGIQGTAAIGTTIGTALATAIQTNQGGIVAGVQTAGNGAAAAAGVISVVPQSMVGVTPNTIVLVDSLASGAQEAVSVGSISYPTFSIAIVNAHPKGFRVTGPGTNPAKNSVLISTVGAGLTYSGLVACWVNIGA